MKKEYKNMYSKIEPDKSLLEEILNKVDETESRKSNMVFKRILAAALCLVILCAAGGIGSRYIDKDDLISQENTTAYTNQSNLNFTITAYAKDDESNIKTLKENISTIVDFELIVADIRGMSEEEIERKQDEIRTGYEDENGTETFRRNFQRLENAIIGRAVWDHFDIDVENPDNVEEIKIRNESDYGYMLIKASDIHFDDAGNTLMDVGPDGDGFDNEFIRGKEVSLSGARFAKCKKLKDTCGNLFEIEWKMDDKLYQTINANPDMDLSEINDTVTFIVKYKDGSIAQSKMNVTFTGDGKMTVMITE